ncbi:MAG: preprotein translocase subunit SecA [Candidatus Paceibacterota bacterium]
MLNLFKKNSGSAQIPSQFKRFVERVNALEPEISALSDEQLFASTEAFRKELAEGKTLDSIRDRAFAVVREVAKRSLSQRHFDVQLVGGAVLADGAIAEMRTGEGKTLMSTLAIYLAALEGKGVHVVTVNEYLAKRDTAWMGEIYQKLGLSVSCLVHGGALQFDPAFKASEQEQLAIDAQHDLTGSFKIQEDFMKPVSRKEAYNCDITHGTNHEFGFDYLRDNLAVSVEAQVQRGQHFAVIDEVDSILIDEARTPLIISAPDTKSSDLYKTFSKVVSRLIKGEDYEVDEKLRAVSITESGIAKVEKALGITNLYEGQNLTLTHYLQESLKAHGVFERDREYVVRDGAIVIVDQFTGRMMPGRRYSGGLHQAIEAKEGVVVQQESKTYASVSIQNYFRLYTKIAGMTGTAQTSAEEFHKVYGLEVVSIPTNKPVARDDKGDAVYKSIDAKYKAIAAEVKERSEKGQPVLIGTVSIDKNEQLSSYLSRAGVVHEVLNAKNNEKEGEIVAQAGRKGAVTVATNMAGRGVDIKLGGNPGTKELYEEVKGLGGLHVIGTERHESRRIDNQLRGRSGRQGDPGSSQFFLSMEDDLMRIFGGGRMQSLMEKLNLPDDQPIQAKMLSRAIESAQTRVEGHHFDSRKHLLEYDDVLNNQRLAIYKKRQELLETKAPLPVLGTLDTFWMEHLEQMEALRESVRLRAVGQKDPLVEYRRDGQQMFHQLVEDFDGWYAVNADKFKKAEGEAPAAAIETEKLEFKHEGGMHGGSEKPADGGDKVGRNDPCPCGSGKKYKKCHGA